MPDIAGLKLIVPTSVAGSGVSVSASGKVTFTAATSVSVNGCFTATYDNYLIVCRLIGVTGGHDLRMRVRLSGTDATGSNYTWQQLLASDTSVTGVRNTNLDYARINSGGTGGYSGTHVYVYGPNLAQPTAWRSVTFDATSTARIHDHAVTHSLSTAYDGFTFLLSANSITGALTVYGLAQ